MAGDNSSRVLFHVPVPRQRKGNLARREIVDRRSRPAVAEISAQGELRQAGESRLGSAERFIAKTRFEARSIETRSAANIRSQPHARSDAVGQRIENAWRELRRPQ